MKALKYIIAYIPILGAIYLSLESIGKVETVVLLNKYHYHITYIYHAITLGFTIINLCKSIIY